MSILLIISFPLAFLIHDLEEILVQHKWMSAHKEDLLRRFPRLQPMIRHLSSLSTKTFSIAGIIIRGYVPGLITSILLLPYSYYGISCICQEMDFGKLILLGVIGFAAIAVNLWFAHWLGKKMQ